jgi:hypothetical protein
VAKPLTWAWPSKIKPLLLEICGSPQYCGRWLAEQIAAGRVRWQPKPPLPPELPDDFWQSSPLPDIDLDECTATKLVPSTIPGVTGFARITVLFQVVREDIDECQITPAEPGDAQVEQAPDTPQKKNWRGPTLQKALKDAMEQIAKNHLQGAELPTEGEILTKLKDRWPDVPRDVARDALDDYAPQLRRRPGESRKTKSRE